MKVLLSTVASVIAGFVLCLAPPAQARVVGSGHAATEARSVSDFEAISAEGSMDLVVRQAAQRAVEVRADDNLLPLIETVVEAGSNGRTLVIRFKHDQSISHHAPITVKIDVVKLNAISTSGSGDVKVESLNTPAFKLAISGSSDAQLKSLTTERLDVRIAGSGDVKAAGSARRVLLSIAGSGDAALAELVADEVTVSIAGSGDADVTANKSLDASVAGSGDVRYGGAATAVKVSSAGSGSVHRR